MLVLLASVRAFHAPSPIAGAAASRGTCSGRRIRTRARPCRATCLRAQQQNDGFDPRFGWFGLELGFVLADAAKQAVRGKTIVGDLIIAGTDCDKLKIRQSQSYVLRRIYWQGVDDATGSVQQVDAEALDDPCPAAATSSICPCIRRGSIARQAQSSHALRSVDRRGCARRSPRRPCLAFPDCSGSSSARSFSSTGARRGVCDNVTLTYNKQI